ncbi:MAG: FAD-dependent oxidoreductase [Desulfatiglandaceae bacterium]
MDRNWDLIVVGGGAGGVPAAIRAEQLGGRVLIVESQQLGGQCMNRGCIPFGHMLEASKFLGSLPVAEEMGIHFTNVSKDFGSLIDRQSRLIDFMRQGVRSTLMKRGVKVVEGQGKLVGKGTVRVNGMSLSCESVILATGAAWSKPTFPGADLEEVVNSDFLLQMKALPGKVLLSGQSPWLLGIAQFLRRYGVQTFLVTPEKRILPGENKTISTRLSKALRNEGVEIRTKCCIISATRKSDGLCVDVEVKDAREKVTVDKLITVDRTASLRELGLREIGLDEDSGHIPVNERMETGVKGVYAIGDVAGTPEKHYSHLAAQQGIIAAENAMGKPSVLNPHTLTRVLFTSPEVACVGMTEKEAKASGYDVIVGAAPLSMNPFGMMIGESEGLIEIIAEKRFGEVLGVNFIGRNVAEMAGQGVLAIQLEATLDDLASASFPHPTLSESFVEAARNALGKHIYMP